jgi:hypothetical protein
MENHFLQEKKPADEKPKKPPTERSLASALTAVGDSAANRFPLKFPLKFPAKFPAKFPSKFPLKFPLKFPAKFPKKLSTRMPGYAPSGDEDAEDS